MKPQSEHQSPGLSALGDEQPTITPRAYAVRPLKPGLEDETDETICRTYGDLERVTHERDTLQAIAAGATLKFAGMELQRDALRDALEDLLEAPNWPEARVKAKTALALCERLVES